MPRLYLIRHALPKPRGADDRDPPLDPKGKKQAEAMARGFEPPAPLPVYTSPLMRCRMTAAPLAARWESVPKILEAAREVPAPADWAGGDRSVFLNDLLKDRWPAVLAGSDTLRRWHDALLAALGRLDEDSVVVSHYVAINAIVGQATRSDQVSSFQPGHASVTVVDAEAGRFELVSLGAEAQTRLTSG
jgi:broad specificity phosphatase PhoE